MTPESNGGDSAQMLLEQSHKYVSHLNCDASSNDDKYGVPRRCIMGNLILRGDE